MGANLVLQINKQDRSIKPLLTIGNSLKKQKSLYKVLTPSIKRPYIFLWVYGSSQRIYASLVGKGLIRGY